jgi:hypothetical protein
VRHYTSLEILIMLVCQAVDFRVLCDYLEIGASPARVVFQYGIVRTTPNETQGGPKPACCMN